MKQREAKEKLNLCVFINSDLHFRNYIETKALNEAIRDRNVKYILSKNVSEKNRQKIKSETIVYVENKIRYRLHNFLFDVLMVKNKEKSISFKYRIKRIYEYERKGQKKLKNTSKKKLWFSIIKAYAALKGMDHLIRKLLIKFNPFDKILEELEVDLILLPSSAYESAGIDIINSAYKHHIKSIVLIDNWDNASSKSIFWCNPDAYCCWGKQSKDHLRKIQNYKGRIEVIGTPRFEIHRELVDKKEAYILFLGTALVFDEEKVLIYLNNLIQKDKLPSRIDKIIYRPHPWRQAEKITNISKLENVEIDNDINRLDWNMDGLKRGIPSNKALKKSIIGAEIVIGGLTSSLIESLLCQRRVIALAHKEKNNILSPSEVLINYEHFKDIDKVHGLHLIKNLDDIEGLIKKIINQDVDRNDESIQNIISYTDEKYSQRLKKVVDSFSK